MCLDLIWGETDRQTDRKTDKQTDRQTEIIFRLNIIMID